MLDWKANLQSNLDIVNSSSQEQAENNEMDVDAPAAEAAENRNSGGLNEQTEDERVIDELLRSNLLNQVASGGTMTDPLCKKLGVNWISVNRPKIPYSEFVNELINNGTKKFTSQAGMLLAEFSPTRNFRKVQIFKVNLHVARSNPVF